jgi:cystathionine gamma-lyase
MNRISHHPTLQLINISLMSHITHSHSSHPLVLADNTFLSPFYSSLLLQGADIVIHPLTEYIDSHSDIIMGIAILLKHHTAYPLTNYIFSKMQSEQL